MNTPVNGFKQALAARRVQIGLWLGLADPYCAEICAGAGFDWLALDAEHGPNTIRTLLSQLQAVASYPVHAVVRAAHGDPAHLKQLLDIGAQTLVVPLVESAEQARAVVRATRYPPDGIRGVGSALARASRWNRHGDYLQRADAQICVIVQAESAAALSHLGEIARVEGVDGVFLGPADLAASLGYRGEPAHPVVREALDRGHCGDHRCREGGRHPHERRSARARIPRRGLQLRRGGCRYDPARARDHRTRGALQGGRRREPRRAGGLTRQAAPCGSSTSPCRWRCCGPASSR